ncbi:MAG: hypothetical protein CM15mV47_480 [uncultured marine virus]|nr:MAG: hypothetical protein CM15mV47_480 [uncultured marine virus]
MTGAGGNAGTGQLASSGNNIAEGVAGGSASGGDFIIHGGDSSAAVIITGETLLLCFWWKFFRPQRCKVNHNANGHNAFSTAYGCGGGACTNLDTNFNRAGGDGADGVVIIYEYL